MDNVVFVNHTEELTRVAVYENGQLSELYIEAAHERRIVGNIYKGKVMRVLPGMNAAFVDAGLERTGFLHALDIVTERVPDVVVDEDESGDDRTERAEKSDKAEKSERTDVKIASLVREGQEIVVQVSKGPIGSKGARLTCNFALPGVLVVLLPNVEHVGISRQIDDPEERQRLKDIGAQLCPPGSGLILRTVAEGRSAEEIRNEVAFLYKLWTQTRQAADAVDAPVLIHEDMSLLLRSARDLVCRQFERLIIDSEVGARLVENFIRRFVPSSAQKVEVYTGSRPIFDHYGVELEITRAVQRRVWLTSGGHIVIDRAEAFTAIDVNSGKFTGKSDPEETILKTNMEAAVEIAYQLRLRNIGGIIVIDFIDMKDKANRRIIHETMVRECEKDHVRTRILPMSDLGLMEMTRKRVTESIVTKLTESCFYCEGKGYLKSPETVAHSLLAKIKNEVGKHNIRVVHAHANSKAVQQLIEHYGGALERLEASSQKSIVLTERERFHLEQFEVFGEAK